MVVHDPQVGTREQHARERERNHPGGRRDGDRARGAPAGAPEQEDRGRAERQQ
jgi:hypothetical protein